MLVGHPFIVQLSLLKKDKITALSNRNIKHATCVILNFLLAIVKK